MFCRLFLKVLPALMLVTAAPAGEVSLRIGDYTANADWETSEVGAEKPAVLIVHGTMGHKDMELIQQAQDLLLENGYDSLAVNLTLNRDNRHGFMPCDVPQTHRHEDAIREIAAWSGWLKNQGRHQLILMGHSRGGLQVAQYQAQKQDPAVLALALLAPMANRASDQPANKSASTFLHCEKTADVAEAARESYRRSGGVSLLDALARVKVPVDVFVGSEDKSKGVVGLTEIADDPRLAHVRGHVIDGADHFFRDLYLDEVIETLVENWQQLSSDVNAIHAILSQQQQAWNRGDIDGFMQGYAQSPSLRFASGDQVTYGWQETLTHYKKRYGARPGAAGMGRLQFQILELRQVTPDFATVFGRWQLDYPGKPSPRGLFTLFWQKNQGQWRIVADHTSSAH